MEDRIYELIEGWAGVPTWYTGHALDERRFSEAMDLLIAELGPGISSGDFENALRRHAEHNPAMLGAPKNWGDLVAEFTAKAMTILQHELNRRNI